MAGTQVHCHCRMSDVGTWHLMARVVLDGSIAGRCRSAEAVAVVTVVVCSGTEEVGVDGEARNFDG